MDEMIHCLEEKTLIQNKGMQSRPVAHAQDVWATALHINTKVSKQWLARLLLLTLSTTTAEKSQLAMCNNIISNHCTNRSIASQSPNGIPQWYFLWFYWVTFWNEHWWVRLEVWGICSLSYQRCMTIKNRLVSYLLAEYITSRHCEKQQWPEGHDKANCLLNGLQRPSYVLIWFIMSSPANKFIRCHYRRWYLRDGGETLWKQNRECPPSHAHRVANRLLGWVLLFWGVVRSPGSHSQCSALFCNDVTTVAISCSCCPILEAAHSAVAAILVA
jgi:hypothetical protein